MKRFLSRAVVGAALSCCAVSTFAATPADGSISASAPTLSYTTGPMPVPNASGGLADTYTCDSADPCDIFLLTVDLPADYPATHPQDRIRIDAVASPVAADVDLQLADQDGNLIDIKRDNPPSQPSITFKPVGGTNVYQVQIVPSTAVPDATGTVTLFTDSSATVGPPGVYSGPVPRYQTFFPPANSPANTSQGEFNIGFNRNTGHIFTYSNSNIFRVTPPELQTPALPESCDATWEDVTPVILTTPVPVGDPILWTEPESGRTFASNFTGGATFLFAYSSDDGQNWTQASGAPPNGSADHETIGTGPYPAGSPFAAIAQVAGVDYATYYCAQGQGPASCQRSDDGGASFGPSVQIYDGVTSTCSGIHGHVHVAPDGTVWVPVRNCGDGQGYALSKDAGQTWQNLQVPGTTSGEWDPSIGLAKDNTAYFCYGAADGHVHALVSHDAGASWINDTDIGAPFGIQNAVFEEAVAGDADRATCGFLGTTTPGNYGGLDFPGIWYLYIASTYDGGQTWVTVPATPNDPVQGAGGICTGGISCSSSPNNRNLLDFNEVTLDDHGYVLFGYDDGCVDSCVDNPSHNSFIADSRVARQTGGKPMYAQFDPLEPRQPRAACLTAGSFRTPARTHLTWHAPDNGGDPIGSYRIYRATSADGFGTTPVATAPAGTAFDDTGGGAGATDVFYKITAVNTRGESVASNVVKLQVQPEPIVETACTLPGITVGTFPAGDATDGVAAHDILSMSIAEPPSIPTQLAFTMKVADLSTLPSNTLWAIRFGAPKPPDNGDVDYFVGMLAENGATRFVWGTVGVQDAQATSVSVYTIGGDIDAASNYTPDGTITLIADRTQFGAPLMPGDFLTTLTGTTRVFTSSSGPIAAGSQDTANGGNYEIRGADRCGAVAPPDVPGGTTGGNTGAVDHGRFGGATGLGLLLPLLGGAALRRRRPR